MATLLEFGSATCRSMYAKLFPPGPPHSAASLFCNTRSVVLFFRGTSPADAVALSLALRALTAGKAFFDVATNSGRARVHASVRLGRAIFLCSWGRSWPALSTPIPLCCNHCRSPHTSLSVFSTSLFLRLRQYTPQNYFGF